MTADELRSIQQEIERIGQALEGDLRLARRIRRRRVTQELHLLRVQLALLRLRRELTER